MTKLDFKVLISVLIGLVCCGVGMYLGLGALGVWIGVGLLIYFLERY